MNFKDCYHSDVCGFECDEATTFCANFKDKSRIIELPCKVGDNFFIIVQRFGKGKYTDFFIDKRQVLCFKYDGKALTIYDFDGIGFVLDEIYFEKSKAEAKLKELNKND